MMRRFGILPILALGLLSAAPSAQASEPSVMLRTGARPQSLSIGADEQRQSEKGTPRKPPKKPGPQGEPEGD